MIGLVKFVQEVLNILSSLFLLFITKFWTDLIPSVVFVQNSEYFYTKFLESTSYHFRFTHLQTISGNVLDLDVLSQIIHFNHSLLDIFDVISFKSDF